MKTPIPHPFDDRCPICGKDFSTGGPYEWVKTKRKHYVFVHKDCFESLLRKDNKNNGD